MAFENTMGWAADFGQRAGAVNSPVSGIGDAIRNILDDARKKGLLQAQSQFQGQEAMNLATFKQGLESTANKREVPLNIIGPGGAITRETTTEEAKNITEPAQSSSFLPPDFVDKIRAKIFESMNTSGGGIFPGTQDEAPASGAIFATNGSQRVYSNDGGNVWRDAVTGKIVR